MKYNDEEDPIDLPDPLKPGFGKCNQEDISDAFDVIFKDASDNGMSPTGLENINELLEKYRSILYKRLGPDDPTKVPPLKIKPVEGAKPFR